MHLGHLVPVRLFELFERIGPSITAAFPEKILAKTGLSCFPDFLEFLWSLESSVKVLTVHPRNSSEGKWVGGLRFGMGGLLGR